MDPAPPAIPAPPFPRGLRWIGSPPIRLDDVAGRPLLVDFWDFCRVHSLRTLPYLRAWHERYADAGLAIVGVHVGGFPPSRDPERVAEAVTRLGIPYPVCIDSEHELWDDYGVEGWPSRYLFDGALALVEAHFGEGGYAPTEAAIGRLLESPREPVIALRPEDVPGAQLEPQTEDQPGAWSGRYQAGGVWAVLEGDGEARVNGRALRVAHPGAYALIEHHHHTAGELRLDVGPGVVCHAVCFTPGVAETAARGRPYPAPRPAPPGPRPPRR